ncbi:MAG: hypothetical protein ABL886_13410, partial [Rhodoglobus sp.]
PGDIGTLSPDGTLVLGGRESELFNLGGVKIDPLTVDEVAVAFPAVQDAAAFVFELEPGSPEIGLAVVGEVCDLQALDRWLRQQLPIRHPTAFWRVTEVPRTRLGKAMRASLTEQFLIARER